MGNAYAIDCWGCWINGVLGLPEQWNVGIAEAMSNGILGMPKHMNVGIAKEMDVQGSRRKNRGIAKDIDGWIY